MTQQLQYTNDLVPVMEKGTEMASKTRPANKS
ncbi:hypothetical protein CLAFUW4_06297 [Fulvia fulva]|nr:uncharacterized protein CLAFUR5_20213 [Fulvia fulva]KAK4623671.1 hypothetical protein CLAFUR4_06300 [Fulvia fulva]KAK4625687.1 hypothetical protein CLAFUR0_06304 [Fulvia fulva]WMI38911.1 hypothetical protein CLAFUR5_20213 [Fulvia fulva]WPV15585.1 hypothetical protein CLAFUW4_06297 [Fulvia fulva]WPV29880.1 hypothetical protein CLAFUW7_06294 [Fulvia fulva]